MAIINAKCLECLTCGFDLEISLDVELGELLECNDCGTEFEIIGLNPLSVEELELGEEDWGE